MLTIPSRSSTMPLGDRRIPGAGSFNCGDLVRHVMLQKPLCYLRWSHGEFVSMMPGRKRWHQADGHRYYPESLGVELRNTLHEASRKAAADDKIRIEINGTWSQWSGMRQLVASIPQDLAPWVVVDSFWTEAVISGDIFYLWDAIRHSTMPAVLVGVAEHEEVASAIGAAFVAAPKPNVWLSMHTVETATRDAIAGRPVILLCGIGMASGCLIWRLWDGKSIMVDCGHVCDAMVGLRTRRYMRHGRSRAFRRAFRQWLRERDGR